MGAREIQLAGRVRGLLVFSFATEHGNFGISKISKPTTGKGLFTTNTSPYWKGSMCPTTNGTSSSRSNKHKMPALMGLGSGLSCWFYKDAGPNGPNIPHPSARASPLSNISPFTSSASLSATTVCAHWKMVLPATFICGDCEQRQPPASASRENSVSHPKTSGRRATSATGSQPPQYKKLARLTSPPLASTSAPVTPPPLNSTPPLTRLSFAIQTPKRKVESFRPDSA